MVIKPNWNYLSIKQFYCIPASQSESSEISVKIGEELKLDVLSNADKVEHQDITSKEWMKVWSRNKGIQSDRMNETDGNLTIIAFTSNDAGMYRCLDSDGELLITVTVTVSSTELQEKLDNTHHAQVAVWVWILTGGILVALGALIALFVTKKPKCLTMNGNNEQAYTPGAQMQETVQEPRTQNDSNGAFSDNRSAEDSVSMPFRTELSD
ncbi:hypothetical protein M9458_053860 [Cirrhinus mrigala]|uniref:Ig-like domain-containing protein n=1 Tax=Cirrhinus mrigala TaxID=683832 RepID=A0ABD0MQK5_CIRMR